MLRAGTQNSCLCEDACILFCLRLRTCRLETALNCFGEVQEIMFHVCQCTYYLTSLGNRMGLQRGSVV